MTHAIFQCPRSFGVLLLILCAGKAERPEDDEESAGKYGRKMSSLMEERGHQSALIRGESENWKRAPVDDKDNVGQDIRPNARDRMKMKEKGSMKWTNDESSGSSESTRATGSQEKSSSRISSSSTWSSSSDNGQHSSSSSSVVGSPAPAHSVKQTNGQASSGAAPSQNNPMAKNEVEDTIIPVSVIAGGKDSASQDATVINGGKASASEDATAIHGGKGSASQDTKSVGENDKEKEAKEPSLEIVHCNVDPDAAPEASLKDIERCVEELQRIKETTLKAGKQSWEKNNQYVKAVAGWQNRLTELSRPEPFEIAFAVDQADNYQSLKDKMKGIEADLPKLMGEVVP